MAPQIDTRRILAFSTIAARLGGVGGAVDIGVAEPFEMGDHRDPAFALHPLDQRAAAARHDHIDMIAHAEHQPDRGAVAGRHQLDRGFGQPRRAQRLRLSAATSAREE